MQVNYYRSPRLLRETWEIIDFLITRDKHSEQN